MAPQKRDMRTIPDAADLLGIKVRTAWRWVNETSDTREFHRERIRLPRPTVDPDVMRAVLVTVVDVNGMRDYGDTRRIGRPRSGK